MTKPKRPNFSPKFRLKAALFAVDQGNTVRDSAEAMVTTTAIKSLTLA